MKLLYGTGNPAKLDAMRHRLAGLGIELIGLKDLGGVKQPEIIEDGKTPLENARKKAEAYFNALICRCSPVIPVCILTTWQRTTSPASMCGP